MVDVSSKLRGRAPREIGSFVPAAEADPFGVLPTAPEMWGVYVLRDLILGSDMNSGLHVLKVKP